MTAAVWIALVSATSLLVGQWATGRLFKRLKDIEDRQDRIDLHLAKTDGKVEMINQSGSERADVIQQKYWELHTELELIKQRLNGNDDERRKQPREGTNRWPRS